jgi:hypothetical protein
MNEAYSLKSAEGAILLIVESDYLLASEHHLHPTMELHGLKKKL